MKDSGQPLQQTVLPRAIAVRLARWCAAAGLVLALGCAGTDLKEVPSAATNYAKALKVLEGYRALLVFRSVDYPRAVALFQEVIDNYPFSEYAPLAELQIAEINEKMGKFPEAASFYQDFVELHPNHPKVPYALYRLGESYVAQMRDPDRDQDSTRKALAQLQFLTTRYPDSEYAAKGQELLGRAQDQLALRDAAIGDFYYRKREFYAAMLRYQAALDQAPKHPGHCANRARLGVSLANLGLKEQAAKVAEELNERCSEEAKRESEINSALEMIQAAK